MSKRLEILKSSLQKKEEVFNEKLQQHFESVKSVNGQPLNDKRNGQATLNSWERQNHTLRNIDASIEKTKEAIAIEENRISWKQRQRERLPVEIVNLMDVGGLNQWQKHPNIFFVSGVEKARIIWNEEKQIIAHKFTSAITDKEQWKKFASIFNNLRSQLNGRY
jgi:hypothetical protein